MSSVESEIFSIPKGRECIRELVTARARVDNWQGLRLLKIAARHQLSSVSPTEKGIAEELVDFLAFNCQEYAASVQTPEEGREDYAFLMGIRFTLSGLFNTDVMKLAEIKGITVEEFIKNNCPYTTKRSEMFRRGKEIAWEYVRHLTGAILEYPEEEPIPA